MSVPNWLLDPKPAELYGDGEYVCLDFETTNLDNGSALNPNNRLVLTAWYCSWDRRVKYSWKSEYEQGKLLEDLERADFIIAHNAKFELQWLNRCGFDMGSKPWWDTYNAEWVISGNRSWRLSLDDCLARRGMEGKLTAVSGMIACGVCPSEIPRSLLLQYGVLDVVRTKELYEDQLNDVTENKTSLLPVIFLRSQATPVLADIESNGMQLDADRVEAEYERVRQEFVRVSNEMDELTGGINARSGKQIAEFVYGELGFKEKVDRRGEPIRTAGGQPKTDEATLLSLKATTEKQVRFIKRKKEYAKLASALDKNLKLFVGLCREREGKLYAELVQGRTVTHRLASSGVPVYLDTFDKRLGCQMQNLPRKYKSLFCASGPGRSITEVDGSQLEFRVAGHLGKDERIKSDIAEGVDIHRYTASVIFDVPENEVTKAQRTAAKAHTFKPLYGGQSGTEGEQRYYRTFGEKYAGLSAAQQEWARQVATHKVLKTEWGMIAYWPQAQVSKAGYLNVKTNVYNWPVQSLATAEIIPIAMMLFWHETRDMDIQIINTVHDSIILDHPDELFPDVIRLGHRCFTEGVYSLLNRVYNIRFLVPLGTGIKSGDNWSESKYEDQELADVVTAIGLSDVCKDIDDGEITLEEEVQ